MPQRERNRTNNDRTAPLRIPAMVGGLFSMDRDFFFKLGGYDEGMTIYGGENIELTIRIWTCGGRVETTPCSRVAHIAKNRKPYTLPGLIFFSLSLGLD